MGYDDDTGAAPTVTARLADYVASAAHRELPADVAEHARLHLLDTIASIVACRDLRAGVLARRHAAANGAGTSPILGTTEMASLLEATFASAITAHGAEINDFCPSAFVQPGPGVVSTALVVGDARERSGVEVLRTIAAGYEVACRTPKAIGIGTLRASGVACHSIGSLFGVATTAGALIGLDAGQANHLLAYCAQQASGSWQWLLDVDHVEKSFVFGGMAVHNALHAALLVESGFTGVPDALDVDGGWLAGGLLADRDRSRMERLVSGLGEEFQLDLVGYKRFPVGGPVQPIVQGMLELMDSEAERDVERVTVRMPGAADTFAHARMPALNARYLIALIVLDGELDFVAAQSHERFDHDATIHALMERIVIEHDPDQETTPRSESATISVEFASGRSVTHHVDHVRGYPSHPMSSDEVIDKARSLIGRHFDTGRTNAIIDTALGIESLPAVRPIIELIGRGDDA